jgi:hypothetical protein
MQNRVFIKLLLFFIVINSNAQEKFLNGPVQESRIFQKNKIEVIQSMYLDKNGDKSHEVFLRKNGLYPNDKNIQSNAYFTVTVLKDDIKEKNGKVQIKKKAGLFNLDFYVGNTLTYKAYNEAIPIWDGRVYEEDNEIIVGGYSSKYNERSVGIIDEKGRFIPKLYKAEASGFPILQIPSDKIIFDPFKKRLIQLNSSGNKELTKNENLYLPIDLYGNTGELLNNIQFEISYQKEYSSLILYGILNGKKIEIASCDIQKSEIVQSKKAFRPELITGASQQGKGEMVSLTFIGSYSKNINLTEGDIYLNANIENFITGSSKSHKITIDGDFQDWRNIEGVSDIQGDYVSYLFENPDTDLLEFKVTNDDKYIYFYTRVTGAHGRTGEKGRYYWYTYIDVDSDPLTGYPPTRDDNCYFGIPIGDDSEAQFEFIGNKFVKTFFGFTGIGAEKEVLSGELELGPSYYSRTDSQGKKRESYKMEYIHRDGNRSTTEDYTEGTSEDIIISLSPDGSEVEVRVEMVGFLKDINGNSLIQVGNKIDIAAGVEGSSDHYNSDDWGADSSSIIYGYLIK